VSAEVDYCRLYERLQRLRCDAGDLSAVWLNDQYLGLEFQPDSPAEGQLALILNYVWWLDVEGCVLGARCGRQQWGWGHWKRGAQLRQRLTRGPLRHMPCRHNGVCSRSITCVERPGCDVAGTMW